MSSSQVPARQWVHETAAGRNRPEPLIVPLAFRLAARVQERPIAAFLSDPTQLANGLLELFYALGADGIVCAMPAPAERASSEPWELEGSEVAQAERTAASLEAIRRLRITVGDQAALVAGLAGPATVAATGIGGAQDMASAAQAVAGHARTFCGAGCDVVLLFEDVAPPDPGAWQAGLRTISNIVKFHRGLAFLMGTQGPLPSPTLWSPGSAPAAPLRGFVTTARELAPDTDLEMLRSSIASVR